MRGMSDSRVGVKIFLRLQPPSLITSLFKNDWMKPTRTWQPCTKCTRNISEMLLVLFCWGGKRRRSTKHTKTLRCLLPSIRYVWMTMAFPVVAFPLGMIWIRSLYSMIWSLDSWMVILARNVQSFGLRNKQVLGTFFWHTLSFHLYSSLFRFWSNRGI